jgi:hypothetical protein
MKLGPVTCWFVRDRPRLKVVQTGIREEPLGVCVRKGNSVLRNAINEAQGRAGSRRNLSRADEAVARRQRDLGLVNIHASRS